MMRAREPLLVQQSIKGSHFLISEKSLGVLPPAIKTRTMARRKCRHLIEKEERGVTRSHRLVMRTLPLEFAANPMRTDPAPASQCLVIAVKLATAITHHRAFRRSGEDVTVWRDAVLQWHWF